MAVPYSQLVSPNRNIRGYHPCPVHLILILLLVEGMLLASERFRWFALNEHKGWTVLIGVASLGVTMALLFVWLVVALIFQWRFQFGIRSLLILTFAVAIPCSSLAVRMPDAKRQREAVEAIQKLGGEVAYARGFDASGAWLPGPPGPEWLHQWMGVDCLADVVLVDLTQVSPTDAGLEHLKVLHQVRELRLCGTQVTDAGLACLHDLNHLQELDLDSTQITDCGLEHVEGLTQLQTLHLTGTGVTDAGMDRLKGLPQLQWLILAGTRISDRGLAQIKAMTQLEMLDLGATSVTDAGLNHLRELPQLRRMELHCTKVTNSALQHLQGLDRLEELNLSETQATDAGLQHLSGLMKLRALDLSGSLVTAEGVRRLQQALPNCKIIH